MTKVLKCCILLLLFPLAGATQQPATYEKYATYRDALELLDKAKYGAAQEKFTQFIALSPSPAVNASGNDLVADSRFYLGLCGFHLLRNNTEALFQEFIRAYPVHSRVNEAWFYIGKLRFLRNEFQEALPALENLEASSLDGEMYKEAQYMKGYCYFAQKNYDKALECFGRLKNSDGPFAEKAAYYSAMVNYINGNYEEALKGFRTVKFDKNLLEDVKVYEATCLLKLGRLDELRPLEDSLSEDETPGTEVAMLLGNAAFERGDYARSRDLLAKCSSPGAGMDRDGMYRLAVSHYEMKDYTLAKDWFNKVLKPDDSLSQVAHYYLGHCFVKLNNFENARTAFRKAGDMTFDKKISEEGHFQYAKASFESRYMEDALAALQKFQRDYPNSVYKAEAGGLIGEILLNTSNFKDAVDYLEEQGNLKSERAKRAYQRAAFFYASDLYQKAVFEKAAEYFKKSFNQRYDAEITLSAYYWYAESLFQLGNFEESIQYYEDYLDQPQVHKHAGYTRAWYGIAWAKFKLKKYTEAAKAFSKYIGLANKETEPEYYIDALLRAGDCELVNNRYAEATNYYTQVRDYNDRSVDYALYQLGIVNFRQNDYEKSLTNYQRLVNQFRKSEYRDDALLSISEIYLTWLSKPADALKYSKMITVDHPGSPLMAPALLNMGISAYNLEDNENAIRYFKQIVFDYCSHPKAFDALQNLNSLLKGEEYDRVFATYRDKCPDQQLTAGDSRMEELQYNTAVDRFHAGEPQSALEKLNTYLKDYPKGAHVVDAIYYKGESFEKLGKQDSAWSNYERVYKNNPTSPLANKAMIRGAEVQFSKGSYMPALELFTAAETKAARLEDRLAAQFGKAKTQMAMGSFDVAKESLLSIYTDPNTTEYSRTKAYVMIGNCNYALGQIEEAFTIFSSVQGKDKGTQGAESQYMITKILFDKAEYDQSSKAALYLNANYPSQNYWKAKAFLILAEDYIALGDTFQATEGTLKSLSEETRFPEIQQQARKRLEEINRVYNRPSNEGIKEDGQ
jgi:TolA-binding protein